MVSLDLCPLSIRYYQSGDRKHLPSLLHVWSNTPNLDQAPMTDVMHRAIYLGDELAVQMMLDAGVSPTGCVQYWEPYYTPLLAASSQGHLALVQLFWSLVGPEQRFLPFSGGKGITETSCLQIAAACGHTEAVALFFDLFNGWTAPELDSALSAAASKLHEDTLAFLLSKHNYTPDAIQRAVGSTIPICIFWPQSTSPNEEKKAARQKRTMELLFNAGADPNGCHTTPGGRTASPLVVTAAAPKTRNQALRILLEKGADPTIRIHDQKTPLHMVFGWGSSTENLRLLLEYGGSPEARDSKGETPLHLAALKGPLEKLEWCLAKCSDPKALMTVNNHGESLLHYAAAGGEGDIVEFLIDHGLDVNAKTNNGWTPLMCALMPAEQQWEPQMHELVSYLLEQGADAGVVTEEGWAPLHALIVYPAPRYQQPPASRDWVVPLVRKLIAHGAQVDGGVSFLGKNGVSLRELQHMWGHRMADFVKRVNAEELGLPPGGGMLGGMTENDTTPLMWAFHTWAMDIFEALMEHFGALEQTWDENAASRIDSRL